MTKQPVEFHSLAPLIPTGGTISEAVAFFTQHMGFTAVWQEGDMAGIRRGNVTFNLIENNNREWAENASYSIGVSDLDALYQEYKDIPARVGALEMKSWGRREFHMVIPSGLCFQFFGTES